MSSKPHFLRSQYEPHERLMCDDCQGSILHLSPGRWYWNPNKRATKLRDICARCYDRREALFAARTWQGKQPEIPKFNDWELQFGPRRQR